MSRLDSGIRRLLAQKHALEAAAERIAEVPGCVMEFGLGNGRTYDHLREILPDREIYVFEREVAAHPDCIPPDSHLFLGDLFETLPQARARLSGQAALAHLDIGNGDKEASVALSRRLVPELLDLLVPGGLVVSDQELSDPGLEPMPLPSAIKPGRIFIAAKR